MYLALSFTLYPPNSVEMLFNHSKNNASYLLYVYVQGDKNIIKFEGDHNSPRPRSYYDAVSIFFYRILHPPQLPTECSNKLHPGAFKVGTITNEVKFMKYFFETKIMKILMPNSI